MLIKSMDEMVTELIPPSQRFDNICTVCQKKTSVKYRITNPSSRKSRYFCNMCLLKTMADLERAHKLMEDDFFYVLNKEEKT